MNKSENKLYCTTFLERLIDSLLRPLPTEVSVQVSDLRGSEFSCHLVRTPAPCLSNAASNGEDVDRI